MASAWLMAPMKAPADRSQPRFVVEFGKDDAPPAEAGRLDGPAFDRNHEAMVGDPPHPRTAPGRCSRSAAAPASTWWPTRRDAGASRGGRATLTQPPRQHRRLARARGTLANVRAAAGRSDAAARRSYPALPGRRLTAMLLHQRACTSPPWSDGRGLIAGAGRRLATTAACSSTDRSTRPRAHRAEQRRVRHEPARAGIPIGACATRATSRRWRRRVVSPSPTWCRCQPTISSWCSRAKAGRRRP